MKIGVVFPQVEAEIDQAAIRDYTQAVEELGYSHILTFSHVLGANPDRPSGWSGPYTYKDPFFEPLVLYSFMAAISNRLEFTTGIIIAPQRQTALLAKQAATLDILCNGRLRLGFGLGWNHVEYESLNENFHNRGKRIEEQVELMKELWTKPLVNFEGTWHKVSDAGINPLPIQKPIPIWFGGHHNNVLKRVAKMGDGWMPNYNSPQDAMKSLSDLDLYLAETGRSIADIGIEVRYQAKPGRKDRWIEWLSDWNNAGATHACVNTMGNGFTSMNQHIHLLETLSPSNLTI